MNKNSIEKMNIVDTFSLSSFQNAHKGDKVDYEVKAAVFLTYSLNPKVILALLHALFYKTDSENNDDKAKSREEASALIDSIVKDLLDREHGTGEENGFKDKFAVYYNNGNRAAEDKFSIADAVAMQFAYPVDMGNASFHPKVYIVKYGPKENFGGRIYYRIMIGSHNLSQSNAIEYGYCFERVADEESVNKNNCWMWLEELLSCVNKKNKFIIMNQRGTKYTKFDGLPVINKITESCISDLPKIVTDFQDFTPTEKDRVFSPFVTGKKIDRGVQIYTTAFELKKRGFVPTDENNEDAKSFFIFSPKEETEASQYAMPHYKVYFIGEKVYAGSLNYTDSAFGRNKEVLVEIPNHKEQDPGFLETVKSWYKQGWFKKEKDPQNSELDIYENFRNWIRDNLSTGAITLEADETDNCLSLTISINETILKQKIWKDISGNDNMPDTFDIKICPENLVTKKQSIIAGNCMTWKLNSKQADLLRSSTIYFYLYDGEREYLPYCRVYPVEKGSDILEEKIKIGLVVDWVILSVGITGASDSNSGNGIGHVNTATFRRSFSLYTLDDLLKAEPNKRKKMLNRMKSKTDLLRGLLEKKEGDSYQDKIFQKIGCMPADKLVWAKLLDQSQKLIEQMRTLEEK